MDFEDAKENIQPLAAGRNASILHASLHVESPQELLTQRRELEQGIHNYKGDDPLEPWYAYISWIEQSFPSGGKESGLEEVLTKCLSRFENEERYFQDRRMVKLYMKFIDSHQHPMECYQQLFNAGIGTMVADFYICWAYHYDLCGNTRKADEIFRRGIACRAQPIEELQEAHHHFGFTVAQRLMYQDDDNVKESTQRQFAERRLALTSLRGHKRKATVGSIRTGAVVKSYTPGTVQTSGNSVQQVGANNRVSVFNDENATPNVASTTDTNQEILVHEDGKSVVRSIIDAARNQENLKEPGPWNKAHEKKKTGKLFSKSARNTDLGFDIHEDIEMDCDDDINDFKKSLQRESNNEVIKAFKYPKNFKNKNLPQQEWITPVTIENEPDPRTFPQYNKCFMYPRANLEFQPEEYRAYCWFRKHGITNAFTRKRDPYWRCNDINVNVRQYPNFAKQSKPQKLTEVDAYFEPEYKKGLKVCFTKLYDSKAKVEYQCEELMARYLRRHDTILMDADMDETTCGLISERVQRRKSFFPSRRSIMPRRTMTTIPIKQCNTAENAASGELVEAKEIDNKVIDDSVVFVKEIPKDNDVPNVNPLHVKFEIFEDTTTNLPTKSTTTSTDNPDIAFKHESGAVRNDLDFKMKASANVNPTKLALPFEIFEDTASNIPTVTANTAVANRKLVYQDEAETLATGVDFKFKTPALPNIAPALLGAKSTTTNKFGFEIYTESCADEDPALMGAVGPCEGAVGGALFDPEETCSTQTFNIFIKSQSVSTPKMAQKVAPPRQFGSILKSIPQPPEIIRGPSPEPASNVEPHIEEQDHGIKEPSEYSPLMAKQLSTILETSEHATTQGTHTTGGTKSSNSTSDGEGEREFVTRLVFPHTALETLEEQSRESSTMPAEVIVSMENINLQESTTATKTSGNMTIANVHEAVKNQPTSKTGTIPVTALPTSSPVQARLEFGLHAPTTTSSVAPTTTVPNFSILADDHTEALKTTKQIGNFTRIDDREDTAAGLAIRSVRFQEDKTETMSKMLLHSRSLAKFQEDTTETLPKIPIPSMGQYETEQHNTMPKLPKETSILISATNATTNFDDSFEFFGQTPPGKSLLHPRYEVSAFKECMEARTPLSSSAKRPCNVNTPNMMHLKVPLSINKQITTSAKSDIMNLKGPTLFEDEVDKITSKTPNLPFSQTKLVDVQKSIAPSVPIIHKVIARDSFVPDFSLIEETQQPQTSRANIQTNVSKSEKVTTVAALETETQRELIKRGEAERNNEMQEQRAKSNLGNSYLKDFSEIMDSQPTQSDSKWHRSATKVQLLGEMKNTPKGNMCNSFLKDFSAIMESQPTEPNKASNQSKDTMGKSATAKNQEGNFDESEFYKRNAAEKPKYDLGSSYLKDFSMIMDSQPLQSEREWRQSKQNKQHKDEQQQQISAEGTKKTESITSLLGDALLVVPTQSAVNEIKIDLIKSPTEIPATIPTSKITVCSISNKPEVSQTKLHINNKSDLGSSYLKDFSFVPESQPIDNANNWLSNKLASSKLNPSIQINDSYLKEFSLEAPPSATISNQSATKQQIDQSQKLITDSTSAQTPAKPLLFLNSFMKDFAGFDPVSTKKTTSRLTFLNESKKSSEPLHTVVPLNISELKEMKVNIDAGQNTSKLLFLDNSKRSISAAQQPPSAATNRLSTEKSFELNSETAMFATNISMIKNSTLLPMNELHNIVQPPTPIKEQSIHIKSEYGAHINAENNSILRQDHFKTPPMPVNKLQPKPPSAPNFLMQSHSVQENIAKGAVPKTQIPSKHATSSQESKIPQLLGSNIKQQQPIKTHTKMEKTLNEQPCTIDEVVVTDNDDGEMSVYFKNTPKTPKIQQHIWDESSPSPKTPSRNVYVHRDVDLNVTNQIIENINVDAQVNPFNGYLQTAFLEQIEFSNYIEELPNCMMVGHVSRLHAGAKVKVNDNEFSVLKLVGEGAYGAVFCGVNSKTGKKCALKQERPPNFWEHYICLEVHSRLNSDDLVCAFMNIDYALIGNNASILISPFSVHGSLITVCNKIKKHTLKNIDEYVVMLLTCELLSIIDHLHAINIIHADIKADNFILMNKLEYPSTQYALQLIDFGVSIDMKLFKQGQTFSYVHNENAFKCVEMREGRSWTYQLDLYGLAGVIHVLLFGKFMDIAQRPNGTWMHKTHIPRYINRTLWDTIFQTLLNVRDCETMPNLQNLRALIKEEIAEKEKFVMRKVAEFNTALISG